LDADAGCDSTVSARVRSAATSDINIYTDEPTLDEVIRAVKKQEKGHAAGCDDIPPELLKLFDMLLKHCIRCCCACLALWE